MPCTAYADGSMCPDRPVAKSFEMIDRGSAHRMNNLDDLVLIQIIILRSRGLFILWWRCFVICLPRLLVSSQEGSSSRSSTAAQC